MPIEIPDQENLTLGSSRINVRDVYVPPAQDRSAGQGMMELAKSLEGLSGAYSAMEANQKEQAGRYAGLYADQVLATLGTRKPTDTDLNNVGSPGFPLAHTALYDSLAKKQAPMITDQWFETPPSEEVLLDPIKSAAWAEGIRKQGLEYVKGTNVAYASSFMDHVDQRLSTFTSSLSNARIKQNGDLQGEALQNTAIEQGRAVLAGASIPGIPGGPPNVEFFKSRYKGTREPSYDMQPAFAHGLAGAIAEAEAATGTTAVIRSLTRTNEQQQEAYANYRKTGQGLAAVPRGMMRPDGTISNGSRHERGAAADIGRGPVLTWLHENRDYIAKKYGLEFLTGTAFIRDPVHIQLKNGASGEPVVASTGGNPAAPGSSTRSPILVTPSAAKPPSILGTLDLNTRPQVTNSDGSVSTVRSMSIEEDGKEVLIPTISDDGKVLTAEEAIALYKKTGQHLGKFDSMEDANAYAETLHNDQATLVETPVGMEVDPANGGGEIIGHAISDKAMRLRQAWNLTDETFNATSSLPNNVRKNRIWESAKHLAKFYQDEEILDGVPMRILSAEQKLEYDTVRKEIINSRASDAAAVEKANDAAKKQALEQGKMDFLKRLADPAESGKVRVKDYIGQDPDLVKFVSENMDILEDPARSSANMSALSDRIFEHASSGDLGGLVNEFPSLRDKVANNQPITPDDIRSAVADRTDLTSADRVKLGGTVVELINGAGKFKDSEELFKTNIVPYIQASTAQGTLAGQMSSIPGLEASRVQIQTNARAVFNMIIRRGIKSAIEQNGVAPFGQAKDDLEDKALQATTTFVKGQLDLIQKMTPVAPVDAGKEAAKLEGNAPPNAVVVRNPDGSMTITMPDGTVKKVPAQ